MRKKYVGAGLAPALLVICLLTMLTLIMTACASSTTSANSTTPTSSSNDPNPVQLTDHEFKPDSITIKKGEKITLINKDGVFHMIENGSWDKPGPELNAPNVSVQTGGIDNNNNNNKTQVGPFNTAGTFHIYCTVHSGMNLAVTVQ